MNLSVKFTASASEERIRTPKSPGKQCRLGRCSVISAVVLRMQENIFEGDFLDDALLKFILMIKHKGSAMVIIFYLVSCEPERSTGEKVRFLVWEEGQNQNIVLMETDEF